MHVRVLDEELLDQVGRMGLDEVDDVFRVKAGRTSDLHGATMVGQTAVLPSEATLPRGCALGPPGWVGLTRRDAAARRGTAGVALPL